MRQLRVLPLRVVAYAWWFRAQLGSRRCLDEFLVLFMEDRPTNNPSSSQSLPSVFLYQRATGVPEHHVLKLPAKRPSDNPELG